MQTLRLTLLSCVLALLGACGGGGGGANFAATFAATLTASQFQNGDWTFDSVEIDYYVYDAGTMEWTQRTIEFGTGTLTLSGNGLSGTTTVHSLDDGDNPTLDTDGDMLDGFTVGETLTIKGHIDGATAAFIFTAANGMTARLIGAMYDGDVTEGANGKFEYVGYWDGIGEVSVPGARSGSDCVRLRFPGLRPGSRRPPFRPCWML